MASEENNVAAETKEVQESIPETKTETKEASEQPAVLAPEPQPPKPVVRKTNFEKDIVYLYQFSRTPVVPSLSPYCLKVETWLRLAGLKYEVSSLVFIFWTFLTWMPPFLFRDGRGDRETRLCLKLCWVFLNFTLLPLYMDNCNRMLSDKCIFKFHIYMLKFIFAWRTKLVRAIILISNLARLASKDILRI